MLFFCLPFRLPHVYRVYTWVLPKPSYLPPTTKIISRIKTLIPECLYKYLQASFMKLKNPQ